MRARNIKPGFFKNEDLAEIDPMGRLLFIGLWMMADREGRLEDRPRRIKMEVFPGNNCDVDALLDDLQGRGFIIRYEVDGDKFIQVCNFSKHQHPHVKEAPSTIPAPDEHQTSTVQAPDENQTSMGKIRLNPDSLITDSLIPESISPSNSDDVSNGKAALCSAKEIAVVCRGFGVRCQSQNPVVQELARQGVSRGALEAACGEAKRNGATSIRYVVRVLESWVKDADGMKVRGASPPDGGHGSWGQFAAEVIYRERKEVVDVDSVVVG